MRNMKTEVLPNLGMSNLELCMYVLQNGKTPDGREVGVQDSHFDYADSSSVKPESFTNPPVQDVDLETIKSSMIGDLKPAATVVNSTPVTDTAPAAAPAESTSTEVAA